MRDETSVEWESVDGFEAQLEAIEGVSVNHTTAVGLGMAAIDFTFRWPGREPAEWPPLRMAGVENSAIIVDQEIYTSEWQIRLAPIPQEGNPREEVEQALKARFLRIVDYDLSVRLASDATVWTPHIDGHVRWGPEVEETIRDIERIWGAYQDLVINQGEFGIVVR